MFGFGATKETVASKEVVRVGYTGKLPTHADFVSANQRYREINELDHVLNGLYPELRALGLESIRFSIGFCRVGGGDRQTVIGTIESSQDSASRRYPFMEFLRYTDPRLYYHPDYAMVAASQQMVPYMADREVEAHRLSTQVHLDAVSIEFEKQVIKQDWLILLEKQLSAFTARDMFVQLVGSDYSFWRRQLACCLLLMRDFIANPYSKSTVGIWLPMGSQEHLGPISQFWLSLLKAFTHKDWRPDVFWTQQWVGNRLYVLCRPMTTSALANVIAQTNLPRFVGWGDLLSSGPSNNLQAIEDYLCDRYTDADWENFSLLDLSSDLISSIEPLMAKRI